MINDWQLDCAETCPQKAMPGLWLPQGSPKIGNLRAPGSGMMSVAGGRRQELVSPLAPPCLSQSVPRRAHLKHEIVLLQPALLCLLGFVAPLNGVTPVLGQLCSHLPQLILMRTQLLLLQRQVVNCEVPPSGCHKGASEPVLPGSTSPKGN